MQRLIIPEVPRWTMPDDVSKADLCRFCRRPEDEHPVYDGRGGPVCMEWLDEIPWG